VGKVDVCDPFGKMHRASGFTQLDVNRFESPHVSLGYEYLALYANIIVNASETWYDYEEDNMIIVDYEEVSIRRNIRTQIKGAPFIPWPWGWHQAPPEDGGGCFAPASPSQSPARPRCRVRAAPWPGTLKNGVENEERVSTPRV